MGKPRQSTVDALNKYCQRQLDDAAPKEKKHYGKPEQEVEKACMTLMRSWGWSVQVIESKANWSPSAHMWVQQGAKQGTLDCMGSTNEGVAVAVEFKAPGKLSSLRYNQRRTLVDKINSNNFSCVVDSAERLTHIYARWKMLRSEGLGAARDYLLSMIPEEPKSRLKDEPLFDEE